MTKEDFIKRRTEIISEMLDNPDENGIYQTTECFRKLDELFDRIMVEEDKTANWFPCKVCQNPVNHFPKSESIEHLAECDTCGYWMYFNLDIDEEEAKKIWNKIMS